MYTILYIYIYIYIRLHIYTYTYTYTSQKVPKDYTLPLMVVENCCHESHPKDVSSNCAIRKSSRCGGFCRTKSSDQQSHWKESVPKFLLMFWIHRVSIVCQLWQHVWITYLASTTSAFTSLTSTMHFGGSLKTIFGTSKNHLFGKKKASSKPPFSGFKMLVFRAWKPPCSSNI